MNDLEREVRVRLKKLRISDIEREEVISEIVTHLEFLVQDLGAQGMQEIDARREALTQLGRPRELWKGIQRAKDNTMRDRFRRVWLPGLMVGFTAYAAQMAILRLQFWPRTVHVFGSYYTYSWLWIVVVACLGGLGAWWSREVGGSVRERIVVALAPAEIMAAAIGVLLPVDIITQALIEHSAPFAVRHPLMVLVAILWMLHSGLPAFIGALPFLRGTKASASDGPPALTA